MSMRHNGYPDEYYGLSSNRANCGDLVDSYLDHSEYSK